MLVHAYLATLCVAAAVHAAPLDADALSQRYRGWHYAPDWVIPPVCLNPTNCKNTTPGAFGGTTDVVQVFQLPGESLWRAVYLQFDGVGYETYMATSTSLAGPYNLTSVELARGQPGVIFSPRPGRPPLDGQPKPVEGSFDYGGITFIGPLLDNYTVGAPARLRRTSNGRFWYACALWRCLCGDVRGRLPSSVLSCTPFPSHPILTLP